MMTILKEGSVTVGKHDSLQVFCRIGVGITKNLTP
jgi:hypothetical protein